MCVINTDYADSLPMADRGYVQYAFHIKDIYNTVNDETLTGSCVLTYR